MTRHIIDNRTPSEDSGRLRNFAAVERADGGPHPSALALLRRETTVESGKSLQHFLRIERGHQA